MKNKATVKTAAIVLAGGRGTRMKTAVQKQYLLLAGKPMIVYALEAFEKSPVDEIVLVTGTEELSQIQKQIIDKFQLKKVKAVVSGGAERYHSVYEGLKVLTSCDIVLIHDGARPLVSEAVIRRAIGGACDYQACVVGMPVKDTIKKSDETGFSSATPDRRYLWQIQTPQAFDYQLIRQAYDLLMSDPEAQTGITDDAMVVEQMMKRKVRLIEGGYENLKVTTPEDLIMAEALLKFRAENNLKKI